MKATKHMWVLFLLFSLLFVRAVLFAQAEKGSQEKGKGPVTTDRGNATTVAQPTAAERTKAEQLGREVSHPVVQPVKGTARQGNPGTKPPEGKTVRGSKESGSKLTPGEIRKLQDAHLTPPQQNK